MQQVNSNINSNQRIIGIDLLKILSMIMMIALHVIGIFGVISTPEPTVTSKLCSILYFPTRCAVNCYALTSGFLCVKKQIKPSRILYIWIQTFMYSFLIALLFKFLYPQEIAFREVASFLLPVIAKKYWYISAYFGLFFFMPLLNIALQKLNKKNLKIFILLIVFFTSVFSCIYQTIFKTDPFIVETGMSTIWLMVLYILGGYIKLYGMPKKFSSVKILTFSFIVSNIINIIIYFIFQPKGWFYGFIYHYNFPTVLISALCLFLLSIKIKNVKNPFFEKVIISFSSATLGVYLIHIHPMVYDRILVKFGFLIKLSNFKFLLALVSAVIGIYILCSLIDILRKFIFKWIKIDKLCNYFNVIWSKKNDG